MIKRLISFLFGATRLKKNLGQRRSHRQFYGEQLECRLTMAADVAATISGAAVLGAINIQAVTRSETIGSAADVDMYRISANAGQRIGFDIDTPTNGPAGLGSYLRLFDAQGRELTFNNDRLAPGDPAPASNAGSDGFDSYIDYIFGSAGAYYIGVSNWQNRTYNAATGSSALGSDSRYLTGSYSLIVTWINQNSDNNDQIGEAVFLGAMTQNRTLPIGTIDSPTDVDMFSFSVVAGQRLAFDIDRPSGNFDSYLRLFDFNGNQLAVNDDGAAPGESSSNDSYLEYSFPTTQTFFVGISGYRNASYNSVTGAGDTNGSMGDYTLIVSAPRSIKSEVISGSNLGLGLRSSIRVTLARADGGNAPIDPTIPTWLIIHGRASRPTEGYFPALIQAVGSYADNDQVLTLDWSEGAFDNALNRAGQNIRLEGSRWITSVATWVANTLQRQGISPSRLDEIGHSWGAHVANEIARSLAVQTGSTVRSFVALDPAVLPPFQIDGNRYTRTTDFRDNSRFSWGFNSSIFGSNESATSAHESFNVVVGNSATLAAHSNVISLFTTMVNQNRSMSTPVSSYFTLNRLQSGFRERWLENPTSTGFEAAIVGTLRNGRWEPQNLGYYSQVDGSLIIV